MGEIGDEAVRLARAQRPAATAHPARGRRAALLAAVAILFVHRADAATPMDLRDATPRWVQVRFETSPPDQPGRLATIYTDPLPGWLAAGPSPGEVRVTIAGADVETRWFQRQRLRSGSFSDYVWTFDTRSGEVVSATLSGVLVRRLELGPIASDVETAFDTEVSTRAAAGYEPGRREFGQLVFPLCVRTGRDCTLVAPVRYDAETGYVNAVGAIVGRAFGVAARTFSPLGEAIFSEREGAPRVDLARVR